MPRLRQPLALPTNTPLSHSHLLPSLHPSVVRALNRLNRPALIDLAESWLIDKNIARCPPHLALEDEDEDEGFGAYGVCQNIDEMREVWEELRAARGSKKDIVERIVEGDWRSGVCLGMVAEADMRYISDHPSSLRWTTSKLVKVVYKKGATEDDYTAAVEEDPSKAALPRFHGPSFVQHLHSELAPVVKAHYHLSRLKALPLTVLRIQSYESPYNTSLALARSPQDAESSKTIYLAFPDGAPFIYISLTSGPDVDRLKTATSIRSLILSAIPKAFSRPHERYTLKPTSLSARSLTALLAARGAGKGNQAQGGWSIYVDGDIDPSPLDPRPRSPPIPTSDDADKGSEKENAAQLSLTLLQKKRKSPTNEDLAIAKRRRLVAESRFGVSGKDHDGKGLDRFEIRIDDPFSATTIPTERSPKEHKEPWIPSVRIVLQGTHVFAGVRKLVETGIVDGIEMPGWMTGEEGVSIGVVREGRILGRANGHNA